MYIKSTLLNITIYPHLPHVYAIILHDWIVRSLHRTDLEANVSNISYPSTFLLTYFRIDSPFAIHPPSVFASIWVSSIHARVHCLSIPMYPHSPKHFRKPNTASAKLYFTSYFLLLNKQMYSIAATAAFLLLFGSNRRKEEEEEEEEDVYVI